MKVMNTRVHLYSHLSTVAVEGCVFKGMMAADKDHPEDLVPELD